VVQTWTLRISMPIVIYPQFIDSPEQHLQQRLTQVRAWKCMLAGTVTINGRGGGRIDGGVAVHFNHNFMRLRYE
jgi:hypothetical protein